MDVATKKMDAANEQSVNKMIRDLDNFFGEPIEEVKQIEDAGHPGVIFDEEPSVEILGDGESAASHSVSERSKRTLRSKSSMATGNSRSNSRLALRVIEFFPKP